MQVDLTAEERDELVRIVGSYLGDTKVEVRRSRSSDYHDQLQAEVELLRGLLEKLKALGKEES